MTRENNPLWANSLENNPLPQLASTIIPSKAGFKESLINSNCSQITTWLVGQQPKVDTY